MPGRRVIALVVVACLLSAFGQAHAAVPLGYLRGYGPKADPVVALTWGLLIISIVVVVIISILVLLGVWLRRARVEGAIEHAPVLRGGNGLPFLIWGVGISSLALVASLVWTVVVLAAVNGPPGKPPLTIEVTGQQWWWKVRYLSDDASRVFSTADEIHIPVGQPVRVKLIGADVIHSFWVPALSGKTDTIPGQVNQTWIEARQPGVYAGQCTEYCGEQHAHMGFLVVAEPPDRFRAWWDAQLRPAAPPSTDVVRAGERLFVYRCGACHTRARHRSGRHRRAGPDASHEPAHPRRWRRAQHDRQSLRLDRRPAGPQARNTDAQSLSLRPRIAERADLP